MGHFIFWYCPGAFSLPYPPFKSTVYVYQYVLPLWWVFIDQVCGLELVKVLCDCLSVCDQLFESTMISPRASLVSSTAGAWVELGWTPSELPLLLLWQNYQIVSCSSHIILWWWCGGQVSYNTVQLLKLSMLLSSAISLHRTIGLDTTKSWVWWNGKITTFIGRVIKFKLLVIRRPNRKTCFKCLKWERLVGVLAMSWCTHLTQLWANTCCVKFLRSWIQSNVTWFLVNYWYPTASLCIYWRHNWSEMNGKTA